MRVLITSGGTKVHLDPVRSITNRSTGSFGSMLAVQALHLSADVIYLTSKEGRAPFSHAINFYQNANHDDYIKQIQDLHRLSRQYQKHYCEYRYETFTEYHDLLKLLCERHQPDVVILSAAVSDYLASHYAEDKIRSNHDFEITFKLAPKIIYHIKDWVKQTFLVGFKLLIDASDEDLVKASTVQIKHGADLVVANNLSSVERGQHEILLIEKDGSFQKHTQDLASIIIKRCVQSITQ